MVDTNTGVTSVTSQHELQATQVYSHRVLCVIEAAVKAVLLPGGSAESLLHSRDVIQPGFEQNVIFIRTRR